MITSPLKLKISLPVSVFVICAASLCFRLFIGATLGPGFDEAYYYAYSLHPALSYFDHPPFVGFCAGFFPYLTGITNPVTVRLGAILLFSLAGLILFVFVRRYLNRSSAIATYALFNITPLFMLGAGTMILPDAGMAFFWICSISVLFGILQSDKSGWRNWVIAGVLTGATVLSKYHGVLLCGATIAYILFYKRSLLQTKGPYLFLLTVLIVSLPVIVWNAQHGFISLAFQGGRAIGVHPSLQNIGTAVGGQAAYLTPFIFVPMLVVIWHTISRGLLGSDPVHRFCFFFGTIPVLLFNGIGVFQQILPHWTLPGYLTLLIPLGQTLCAWNEKHSWIKKLAVISTAAIIILLAAAYLHVKYGVFHLEKLAERGWIKERDFWGDATLDVVGWEQVRGYLQKNNIDPQAIFLFTHHWFTSGEVNLATKGKFTVMCFCNDPHGYGIWDKEINMVGHDGICISTNTYRDNAPVTYKEFFDRIDAPDSATVYRGGVASKMLYFYKCKNLLKPYSDDGAKK